MTNLSVALLVIVVSIQVTVSQEMGTENDRANIILSALCVEQNGQISQECLNGLTSQNLYRTLYAALASSPRLGDVSSKSASRPDKLALPAKRRREDTSGFYSNW
ncbi:uncharacterized protein LOC124115435 [Haliotis rufescens]|uniref:uncharacterized protein LOC124115435 n=1 Tax=Haliotis rufescens TaxID=6454 RepID=UPI001EAFE505|nr:uncharacterized protein LOC124115435 [Haliotis rufescens]